MDLEPWIANIESKIKIDFELAERASRRFELDDLFHVCGKKKTYSLAEAKRLHKQEWTKLQYDAALDIAVKGKPQISQRKMLEILRLRSKYVTERGATLNNPHITRELLAKFVGTNREIVDDQAASIRRIALEFIREHPGHTAARLL